MRPLMLLTCLAVAVPVAAWADDIELVSGDQLKGKVVEMTEQHVVLEHPTLGRLKIDADKIKSVTLYGPLSVDPEAVVAPEVEAVIVPTEVPQTEAPQTEAPQTESPQTEAPQVEASQTVTAPATKDLQPMTPDSATWLTQLHDWNAQLELGVNGSQGNSETADLRVALTAGNETEARRWAFDTAYFYSASDGNTTRSDFTLGYVNDWLFKDSPWFVFASGRVDFDDFQDWDYRVNAAVGVGYELIDTDTLTVRLRGGVGGVKEFGSDDEDLRPEGSAGGELKWLITPSQTFAAAVTAYPSFDEFGEVRVRASADWTLKVDQADGVSLKLGVVDEYDSLADGGTDKNDFKYYGALVIDF